MNWPEAVMLMRLGHVMRRDSDAAATVVNHGQRGLPVVYAGCEGCTLLHAWDFRNFPALIFIGAESRCAFIPDEKDKAATDWRIEK